MEKKEKMIKVGFSEIKPISKFGKPYIEALSCLAFHIPLSTIIQKILPELEKEYEKWILGRGSENFTDYLKQKYAKQKK